jgi:hypothetical protein
MILTLDGFKAEKSEKLVECTICSIKDFESGLVRYSQYCKNSDYSILRCLIGFTLVLKKSGAVSGVDKSKNDVRFIYMLKKNFFEANVKITNLIADIRGAILSLKKRADL